MMAVRGAAEKAWNAVVQATNELLQKKAGTVPKAHSLRANRLRDLEQRDPKIAALHLEDRFRAREQELHAECFYERICDPARIENTLAQKVKVFLGTVERL